MKPLVEYIARSLVDDPDAVEVRQREAGRTTIVELTVAPDDTGTVLAPSDKRGSILQRWDCVGYRNPALTAVEKGMIIFRITNCYGFMG